MALALTLFQAARAACGCASVAVCRPCFHLFPMHVLNIFLSKKENRKQQIPKHQRVLLYQVARVHAQSKEIYTEHYMAVTVIIRVYT